MTEPALSLHVFDPVHRLHVSARAAATLLFEGTSSRVLERGPAVERDGDGWRAELDGEMSLRLDPVAAPAELDGVTAHLCRASGEIAGRRVDCLGTVGETHDPPAWDRLDAVRSIAALFDRDNAFLALSRRPHGARGHDVEETVAWLLRAGQPVAIEETRISTVYDGDGRQRSAGLELWIDGEDFPLRLAGSAVAGSSLQLQSVDVHAAIFAWRMGDREGSGAYELMARSAQEAA